MPITASRRDRYPASWPLVSLWIRIIAGWRCEECHIEHGAPTKKSGRPVVLTVHHIDGQPENCVPGNLVALCQNCHLRRDAALHQRNAATTRRAKMSTLEIWEAITAPDAPLGGQPL